MCWEKEPKSEIDFIISSRPKSAKVQHKKKTGPHRLESRDWRIESRDW